MKVYVEPPAGMSLAMHRVASALEKYSPDSVGVVTKRELADLVVLHVVDYNGVPEVIQSLQERKQRYAIIQYCLRSTSKPSTRDWINIWRDVPVWSYYDLRQLCIEDYADVNALSRFYFAPLGCDPEVFYKRRLAAKYLVITSGYVAESECVDAVSAAVRQYSFDSRQFHLGPDLKLGAHVTSKRGISDTELARVYNSSEFVTGLRRTEGFELPIVEGFFCGCRPITFDRPHYKEWFSAMAEFIPEGTAEEVTASVLEIFKRGRQHTTPNTIKLIQEVFDWSALIPKFWEMAL